ncbi:GNAT family N-acetyltransferase [Chelativorans salis]|uniref:GNAT family N-acetyltransferase n=1 Tax=Chelativorans salis TaxID=2978478 RepID=A0ABT2LSV5_9HYPH|nr:GNAT family N-acetyltransferase [Chelativorans sp. EGI FJ00035]MCT7376264.1 GNAT family N-acetyltransferase [Chelativorans sp. EGI FJ00035]
MKAIEMRDTGVMAVPDSKDMAADPIAAWRRGRTRPMEKGDIASVAKLFNCIFRKNEAEGSPELHRYLETVTFSSPLYTPENGSIVHENAQGEIDSAILSVPMQLRVGKRTLTARLLCAFMAKDKSGALGAAHLARTLRAKHQDFCFSDNASPRSADHWEAGGGRVLPVQSLEWQRVFRPFTSFLQRLFAAAPALRKLPLRVITVPLDRLARRLLPSFKPAAGPGYRIAPAGYEEFREYACTVLKRFYVRPAWSREEFSWLIGLASQNTACGPLNCRKILDPKGETAGFVLYFGEANGIARVLNLICAQGREREVIEQLCAFFDAEGYCDARGMAQPFLMKAIMRQRQLTFRHSGYFCMASRHPEIVDAVLDDNMYIGGLASESWSNLLVAF